MATVPPCAALCVQPRVDTYFSKSARRRMRMRRLAVRQSMKASETLKEFLYCSFYAPISENHQRLDPYAVPFDGHHKMLWDADDCCEAYRQSSYFELQAVDMVDWSISRHGKASSSAPACVSTASEPRCSSHIDLSVPTRRELPEFQTAEQLPEPLAVPDNLAINRSFVPCRRTLRDTGAVDKLPHIVTLKMKVRAKVKDNDIN